MSNDSGGGGTLLAILLLYGMTAIFALYALLGNVDHRTIVGDDREQEAVQQDRENRLAERCFSAAEDRDYTDANGLTVHRRRDLQRDLLGPIVPVNCSKINRYCLKAENCTLFCKDASVVKFDCVDGVCVSKPLDADKPTGDDTNSNCDTKNGEYGLLVGYNEIGVAQWECVQLYPAWRDTTKYCEGGRVDIDVRVREPSYRDCLCPEDSVRIVYRKSVLGQTVYGLPHCVPRNMLKFYELSYEQR